MSKWTIIKKLYIDKGIKIFPVAPNNKTPLIDNWLNDCSSDYMQILYWYENCKDCNIGIPATPNDLFILDLDVHDVNKNGIENFNNLLNRLYEDSLGFVVDLYDICDTLMQKTPSGGLHIIYKTDDDLKKVLNSSN